MKQIKRAYADCRFMARHFGLDALEAEYGPGGSGPRRWRIARAMAKQCYRTRALRLAATLGVLAGSGRSAWSWT